jgi:L-ascorbate metabolism protein UlaG (beta-lactamase superfamily)
MLMTTILIIIIIAACIVIYGWLFTKQPKFGRLATGKRLQQMQQSPNYRDGKFQNIHPTPDLTEGFKYSTVLLDFFFRKSKRSKPSEVLPSAKVDLLHLDPAKNILVWFGHSSYFLQTDGKKILVDPVFSGAASPIRFTTKAFKGSDVYSPADFPDIDYLFISHDHWDHLDYDSVKKLRPKIGKIITGLGTGEHLRYWGYDENIIIEKDWNETVVLDPGFAVTTAPGRHFSGRGFKRNTVLWMGFALQTPSRKIFIGGDSGYDTHFAEIGEKLGPFDLALLECGQYNAAWKYIHMMPEEVVQAAIDLKAKNLMPVHWGKFDLSLHAWDEPVERVVAASETAGINIVTPMIGEEVDLNTFKKFSKWWRQVR